jgi:hypothetical protein
MPPKNRHQFTSIFVMIARAELHTSHSLTRVLAGIARLSDGSRTAHTRRVATFYPPHAGCPERGITSPRDTNQHSFSR